MGWRASTISQRQGCGAGWGLVTEGIVSVVAVVTVYAAAVGITKGAAAAPLARPAGVAMAGAVGWIVVGLAA